MRQASRRVDFNPPGKVWANARGADDAAWGDGTFLARGGINSPCPSKPPAWRPEAARSRAS